MTSHRLHVLVLGGNYDGLGEAPRIRHYEKDKVTITVVDH
jgi:hypothetical protein